MAIRLADTLECMSNFPAAYAKDIEFDDGKNLQEKLNNGELGGGGGGSGEENTIKSISINGSPISPDENKNVDIPIVIPTTQIDNQVGRIWLA